MKRKIAVVTGSRAEYGLLYWLMQEIREDAALELQLVVTGMHLSPEFGLTYKNIENDGFIIDEKIEMLLSSDTPVGIGKSMGIAIIGFADAFARLKPDIVVLLGDRFEILAAAQAALVARLPMAHIHGGEATEGLIDEAIRHSITKMAQIHFVAAEPYRNRVIQMGEQPQYVLNVGAPGLDNINKLKLLTREQFEEEIGFSLGNQCFLVTYHPVTLDKEGPQKAFGELLGALDMFPDARIIFTRPNADTDGRGLINMVEDYGKRWPDRVYVTTSLGQLNYLSAISHVDLVLGNSSSGLIEVPSFKKPTVNIGDRQRGRLMAESVLQCEENMASIIATINKALSSDFQRIVKEVQSPFGNGNSSYRMKEFLKSIDLTGILKKKFYDLDVRR